MVKKQLKLTIIEAKDLKIRDLLGASDPYVRVMFDGYDQKTKVKHLTLNPKFNHTFTFDVQDETMSIKIYFMDYDPLTDHDSLGDFLIPLTSLFEGKMECWARLNNTHQGLVHYSIEAIGFGKVLKNAEVMRKQHNMTMTYESTRICAQEHNYVNYILENRVTKCLKKFLGVDKLKKVPVVALSCSGGGMRACTGTTGSVEGLYKSGLVECLSYFAGLSGSTWYITPMYQLNVPLRALRETIRKCHNQGLLNIGRNALKEICSAVVRRLIYKDFSTIDIYGCMLANLYLDLKSADTDFDLYKSSFADVRNNELMANFGGPLPILSAILVREGIKGSEFFRWFEFTPFLCGFPHFKSFVQSEMFGCHFKKGKMKNSKFPQEDLGFLMGICGSAFQGTIQYTIDFLKKDNKKIGNLLDACLKEESKRKRPKPAVVPNYARGTLNGFSKDKEICLVDAGLEVCVPLAPLLRKERKVDIIILCDYSGDLVSAPELQKAQKHAEQHNLPFPEIDYKGIEKKPVSVWYGKEGCPTLIYLPLLHSDGFYLREKVEECFPNYGTFKLQYDDADFNALADLCAYNMKKHGIPAIKKELLKVINK